MNLRNVFAAAAAAIVCLGLAAATAGGSGAGAAATPARGGAALRAACPRAPAGDERCFALFAPQLAVNAAIAARVRGAASEPARLEPGRHRGSLQAAGAPKPGSDRGGG